MEGCTIKYDNISKLYNFIDVTNECIMLKHNEKTQNIYIYEIEPVTFLNFSIDVQSNILNLYSEFLRELNLEFQIFISNKKVNPDMYIKGIQKTMIKNSSKRYIELYNEYIASIKEQIEKEEIYTTKFYIVISLDNSSSVDIITIDNIIKRLESIGCHVNRIVSKNKLKTLLYESINKEVVI